MDGRPEGACYVLNVVDAANQVRDVLGNGDICLVRFQLVEDDIVGIEKAGSNEIQFIELGQLTVRIVSCRSTRKPLASGSVRVVALRRGGNAVAGAVASERGRVLAAALASTYNSLFSLVRIIAC